jgi:hypothetical protein
MSGEKLRLKINPFTEQGWVAIDDLVATALKRGNGRGEPPHVDILLASGIVAELPRHDIDSIGRVVDDSDSVSVEFSTETVLATLNNTVRRAKAIEADAERY